MWFLAGADKIRPLSRCPFSGAQRRLTAQLNRPGWLNLAAVECPSISAAARRDEAFLIAVNIAKLPSALIAAGIASTPFIGKGQFLSHWILSWLISWAAMLPFVLFAAPTIRALSILLTKEEPADQQPRLK